MIKLNNKGFAVSAVLYTLLIAFLLFLGVTLAQFSASTNILNNANKDIINGTEFSVKQVKTIYKYDNGLTLVDATCKTASGSSKPNITNGIIDKSEYEWWHSDTIIQIKSRYGTMYWPKDFNFDGQNSSCSYNSCSIQNNTYKNITVSPGIKSSGSIAAISIYDVVKKEYLEKDFQIFDICK